MEKYPHNDQQYYWRCNFENKRMDIFSGTTYQGHWDGWYGPDGRNDKRYNFNILYSSPTTKNLKKIGMDLPTKSQVAQLREEAELKCSKPKKKSNCSPLQQVCLFNITADPCEFDNLLFKVN